MKAFWEWKGKLEAMPGSNITDAIVEAITIAKDGDFTFDVNGVTVRVRADSDPALILRDWQRAMSGKIDGPVGPYPSPVLNDSEQAHDAEVEASNNARRAASQAEYDKKQREREDAAATKLANAPALDLADADGWAKGLAANADGYGRAVFTFAERWARLMQVEMAAGAKLADIADRLVSEADIEGITGFMYGCAVSILSKCWRHGEELRRWHNVKTQIGTEGEQANESGGVLNPALLRIG